MTWRGDVYQTHVLTSNRHGSRCSMRNSFMLFPLVLETISQHKNVSYSKWILTYTSVYDSTMDQKLKKKKKKVPLLVLSLKNLLRLFPNPTGGGWMKSNTTGWTLEKREERYGRALFHYATLRPARDAEGLGKESGARRAGLQGARPSPGSGPYASVTSGEGHPSVRIMRDTYTFWHLKLWFS